MARNSPETGYLRLPCAYLDAIVGHPAGCSKRGSSMLSLLYSNTLEQQEMVCSHIYWVHFLDSSVFLHHGLCKLSVAVRESEFI